MAGFYLPSFPLVFYREIGGGTSSMDDRSTLVGPIDMLVIPVLKSGLRHQFLVVDASLRRAITIWLQCFGAGDLRHG